MKSRGGKMGAERARRAKLSSLLRPNRDRKRLCGAGRIPVPQQCPIAERDAACRPCLSQRLRPQPKRPALHCAHGRRARGRRESAGADLHRSKRAGGAEAPRAGGSRSQAGCGTGLLTRDGPPNPRGARPVPRRLAYFSSPASQFVTTRSVGPDGAAELTLSAIRKRRPSALTSY